MQIKNRQNACGPRWPARRWAMFVLAALMVLMPLSSLTRTHARGALMLPPPDNIPQTHFGIYRLNTGGGVEQWTDGWRNTAVPGFNIVRAFTNSYNQPLLFMLNGNTGQARTYQLGADGTLGPVAWFNGLLDNPIPELRCTGAEIARIGNVTYLVTHDSFTGKIRRFALNEDGSPQFGSMSLVTLNDWKDKNLFSLYYFNGNYYRLGYDTWTGAVVTQSFFGGPVATSTWTRGWTSVDHLALGGVTYRALYKAAGDPYKQPGESSDQLGRLIIQKLAANSVEGQNIYDQPVGDNYSAVRFVPVPNGQGGWKYMLFRYKRATGEYVAAEFDPQQGLGQITASNQVKDDQAQTPPYVDVEPYSINGQTYLAFINDDNAKPFNYDQAEQMGRTIHDELINETVGYQFMLAQSGRVLYSRAWGKSQLGDTPAAGINMTARTPLNWGSAGKMITAMTVLKLADNGAVKLDEPIIGQVDPTQYEASELNPWVQQRPVRNLLAHTSGVSSDGCQPTDDYKMDCKGFFATAPDLNCTNDGTNCARNYNNSNFSAARVVIEHATGARTSEGIEQQTHELWATNVGLKGMTCRFPDDVDYFGPCNGASGCLEFAGRSWLRGHADTQWSQYCGSGGWSASSRDAIEFLTAIRYRKVLSKELSDLLLDTESQDVSGAAGSTALSWEPPWDAMPGDGVDRQLGKNGAWGNSWGFRAYITRLPNNCDAVILVNTALDQHPESLLKGAYQYAAGLKTTPPLYYDFSVNGSGNGGQISRVAVNTVKSGADENHHVVAVRDVSSWLRLRAYRVTPGTGVVALASEKVAKTPDNSGFLSATSLALTDGADFATASLNDQSQLNIIGWKFNGAQLTQHGQALGPVGSEVAATKAAGTGATGRIVTAIRNAGGKLQLHAWEFNNSKNTLTQTDSYEAELASGVTIKTLRPATDSSRSARVVTAVYSNGKLQIDVWEVDKYGKLLRRGQASYGKVNPVSSPTQTRIVLDTLGDGASDFFDGSGFMTAFINAESKLDIATWRDGPDTITLQDEAKAGEIRDLALAATTTTVRLPDSDLLKLIKWEVSNDGTVKRGGDYVAADEIAKVAATGNVVTALRLKTGELRFVNWRIVN